MSRTMDSTLGAAKEHMLGPVSATLVAELREDARKHGVLVWLDKDGNHASQDTPGARLTLCYKFSSLLNICLPLFINLFC